MYSEYLEDLRSSGRRSFTSKEIRKTLNLSEDAAKSGLYRLKRRGKLISPINGLYVLVPPEHRPYGSIPAEELVPLMMKHLEAEYYVALLSAAAYFGVAHQKPAKFQVMCRRRIKHSLKFGQVVIELVYKGSLSHLPTQDFLVSTGYLKVATPELIAIDLFKYYNRGGGISHIVTVLFNLVASLDGNKLINLAKDMNEICQIQRIGYVVEKIDLIDEDKKENLVKKLLESLNDNERTYIPLVCNMPTTACSRCKKWKIIENTDFERDFFRTIA